MARLALALLTGLVGAAIVHIAVLFLAPRFSDHDAWSRLAAVAELYETVPLTEAAGGARPLLGADPLMRAIGCRFDLTEGIAHITATGEVPFWSIAVFDRGGLNVFSINDKTAGAGVDIVLATPFQAIELRKALPEEFSGSIIAEVPEAEGLVVLRAFEPDWTFAPMVRQFLDAAACRAR